MKKITAIHFVGIKGVGMTPLAVIAKEAGIKVTGSDVPDIYITDAILAAAEISVFSGFAKDHVGKVDLVITTGAHGGFDNVEVIEARSKGISVITQGEAVGLFMSGEPFGRDDISGISIAGCHGKTTTTAMIATMLKIAGKDPSFIVGTGLVPSLGSSGHFGKGKYFVAEADEYATEPKHNKTPKFLWHHPDIAVITNIEYDHPDLYPTFASLVAAYTEFILQVLGACGTVIACGDDPEIRKIIENNKGKFITYGFNSDNNYVLSDIESVIGGMSFHVSQNEEDLGEFTVGVLGEHNTLNGLATIIVGLEKGLSIDKIQKGLLAFKGTKRRLEFVGKTISGAHVFDDYAHHPTEIQKTLKALRERYPQSHIVCVFQPHTFSRTKLLFDQFKGSFKAADAVVLTDIYASQREPFDPTISSKHLAEAMGPATVYFPLLQEVLDYLKKKEYHSDTIVVTMGAGDVYKVAYELVSN